MATANSFLTEKAATAAFFTARDGGSQQCRGLVLKLVSGYSLGMLSAKHFKERMRHLW